MKKEYILVFIIFCILSVGSVANLCRIYFPFGFDNQVLTTWQFSAKIGQLPYRDIFYPYGLVSYYKGLIPIFSAIYYLITPLLFTIIYYVFVKCFKNRLFSLFSVGFLYLFVVNFTGLEYFIRYGISAAFALLASLLLFERTKLFVKNIFVLGLLSGVIYFLFNDQGIYSIAIFLLLLILKFVVTIDRMQFIVESQNYLRNVIIYFLGLSIALLPFFTFLLLNGAYLPFINSFKDLSHLEELAKVPYFHGFVTFDNFFTLGFLFFSLFYVLYRMYKDKAPKLSIFVIIGLLVGLVVCEQKNLVRLNDGQLTFYGIILFSFLYFEILRKIKLFYVLFVIIAILILHVAPFRNLNWNGGPYNCGNRFEIQDKKLNEVITQLRKIEGFDGKIFSYPADTIFYVMLKQAPPYYPSSFEASSKDAQEKLIKYIESNNIKYVIYNHKNVAVQDEVPNIIRTPYLNKYILTNFSLDKVVGDFLILKKARGDFIGNKKLLETPLFKKYLLDVDLQNIPRSEGIYKSKYLKNAVVSGSISQLNDYLYKSHINSDKKLITITFENESIAKRRLTIKTENGTKTNVYFTQCNKEDKCIFNLARLPLFYKNKTLKSVSIDVAIRKIEIYQIDDESIFW